MESKGGKWDLRGANGRSINTHTGDYGRPTEAV